MKRKASGKVQGRTIQECYPVDGRCVSCCQNAEAVFEFMFKICLDGGQ